MALQTGGLFQPYATEHGPGIADVHKAMQPVEE
jgi:hypothetical protein